MIKFFFYTSIFTEGNPYGRPVSINNNNSNLKKKKVILGLSRIQLQFCMSLYLSDWPTLSCKVSQLSSMVLGHLQDVGMDIFKKGHGQVGL